MGQKLGCTPMPHWQVRGGHGRWTSVQLTNLDGAKVPKRYNKLRKKCNDKLVPLGCPESVLSLRSRIPPAHSKGLYRKGVSFLSGVAIRLASPAGLGLWMAQPSWSDLLAR